MALNFPNSPVLDQLYIHNKKFYKWDGVSWKQLNTTKERFLYEYADFYSNTTSNNITLDLRTFNNFKVAVTSNTDITIVPNGSIFSQFVMQLDYTTAGYDTSVEGFYLSIASYDNVSFSVAAQETAPYDIFFKPDGTKMYMLGAQSDTIYQYTLSTPWDVNTASYDSLSFSVAAQDGTPISVFFKDDGTRMFILGYNNRIVYQYTLSTDWDISTASYDAVSFSVASQSVSPLSIFFKPDGTKMYLAGLGSDTVFQYTLSTPWVINTASYDSVGVVVATQPYDFFLKPDGTKMYVMGTGSDSVYQYSLSSAWDISTASYDAVSFSVAVQDTFPVSIFFKPDGTKMYIVGAANINVYQYTTAAPAYHTINWSNNVIVAPNTPYYTSSSIIEFTTFDGSEWTASTLSNVTG